MTVALILGCDKIILRRQGPTYGSGYCKDVLQIFLPLTGAGNSVNRSDDTCTIVSTPPRQVTLVVFIGRDRRAWKGIFGRHDIGKRKRTSASRSLCRTRPDCDQHPLLTPEPTQNSIAAPKMQALAHLGLCPH